MKKTIIAMGILLALPLCAFAQTPSIADLQTQVQALLAQVTQLQQKAGGSGATAGTASTSAVCPKISRSLKRGVKGDDVTRLQKFLAQDPAIYPEGLATGFYGALTEAAVKRWQGKNNVVSSGTPETTGYGVVGPRTAAAIALLCAKGSSITVPTTKVGGYIQVSPVTGNAPLDVNAQVNVNTTDSCEAATYDLDWGDNSGVIPIPVAAGSCNAITQQTTHTYQTPGTYQMILSAGTHRTTAQIVVLGAATSTPQ